jgi:hypothetical protein
MDLEATKFAFNDVQSRRPSAELAKIVQLSNRLPFRVA